MYDSVNANNLPANGDLYAGYVGGNWPNFIEISKKFPKKRVVSIAVQANEDAQVLDIESGDATPDQAPAWVNRMRFNGRKRPTIYTSRSNMSAVIAALDAAKVAHPDFWIADWTNSPHSVPGAVAVQYMTTPEYDKTCITDPYWPDVKPVITKRIVHKVTAPVRKVAKVIKRAVIKHKVKSVIHKKA